jgi:hypothetical protein
MARRTRVALATQHGKERQLAPPFAEILGWDIEVAAVDTDTWGTFSGDIPRLLSPRDTALGKARSGALSVNLATGLGSEGTIGPHPSIPFLTVDQEVLAFVDLEVGYDVVERVVSTDIVAVSEIWHEGVALDELVERADLPRHALIAKTKSTSSPMVIKGLTSRGDIEHSLAALLDAHPDAEIVLESDHRAMMSPSRQAVIEQCARKLATRLSRLCPSCSTRGWGVMDHERGAPCRECGTLSLEAIVADVEGCVGCEHRVIRRRDISEIDPAQCQVCNP